MVCFYNEHIKKFTIIGFALDKDKQFSDDWNIAAYSSSRVGTYVKYIDETNPVVEFPKDFESKYVSNISDNILLGIAYQSDSNNSNGRGSIKSAATFHPVN